MFRLCVYGLGCVIVIHLQSYFDGIDQNSHISYLMSCMSIPQHRFRQTIQLINGWMIYLWKIICGNISIFQRWTPKIVICMRLTRLRLILAIFGSTSISTFTFARDFHCESVFFSCKCFVFLCNYPHAPKVSAEKSMFLYVCLLLMFRKFSFNFSSRR